MKSIVFIGDIHGDYILMKKIIKQFPKREWRRIWVGDFVDSFDKDLGSQLACMNLALMEEVLWGNHDFQYLNDSGICSGHSNLLSSLLIPIKPDMSKHFKHHIYIPEINTLVTHAGLSQTILDEFEGFYSFDPKKTDELETFLRDETALMVGKARGGSRKCGGHLWCDWNNEFKQIKDLSQVMGHTIVKNIEFTSASHLHANANVDCLEHGKQHVLIWDGKWETKDIA